jgi:hypothetical protein
MLSSMSMVVRHHDVIKYMLHKPILSGRIGKWAYSLIEYDLVYEPLHAMKGQVIANFIVDHSVSADGSAYLVKTNPWELFIDGSVCSKGQGVGCVLVSPSRMSFRLFIRLEFTCMNNQAEYEALLCVLE